MLFACLLTGSSIALYSHSHVQATVTSYTQDDHRQTPDGPITYTASQEPVFLLNSDGIVQEDTKKTAKIKLLADKGEISATLLDNYHQTTDINPVITSDGKDVNKFLVNLTPNQKFTPGKFTLSVQFTQGSTTQRIDQDFTWGVLALNLNQSSYKVGETAEISMAVLDNLGKTLCDSELTLMIESPNKEKEVFSTTQDDEKTKIKTSGICANRTYTNVPDYLTTFTPNAPGTYSLTLTAHTINGSRTINDRLVVIPQPDFLIHYHDTAMRLYPYAQHPYSVNRTITTERSFNGTIRETVPNGFEIEQPLLTIQSGNTSIVLPQENMTVSSREGSQIIEWRNITATAGSELELRYSYLAPLVSPEFYLLGPLEFISSMLTEDGIIRPQVIFTEPRAWQLASDNPGVLNFTGFETGDNGEGIVASGSIQTTTKRTGTYAFQANPTTTNTANYDFQGQDATGTRGVWDAATIYARFYFNYATKPASASEEIFIAQTTTLGTKFTIRIDSAGKLSAWDNTGTNQLGSTGTTVLSSGTWYRIEAKIGTGTTAAWEVKINGTTEISGTGDLRTINSGLIKVGKVANRNSQTVNFFYDDIKVRDDDYPGSGEVKLIKPNASGSVTNTNWNTTDATCSSTTDGTSVQIDEVPHNSDTDFICNKTSSGGAVTFNVEDTSTASITGNVKSVKSLGAIRKVPSQALNMQIRLRSGATEDNTTAADPGTSYVFRSKIYETDPADSAAWTLTDVDNVEVGVVHAQGNAREARATALYVMVDYQPPASVTVSGRVFTNEGSTGLDCSSARTVRIKVNGLGSYSASCSNAPSNGTYSISSVSVTAGDVVSIFLDGATEKATTVTRAIESAMSNIDLYQDRLIIRSEDGGNVTNTNLGTYDNDDDADLKFYANTSSFTCRGASYTGLCVDTAIEVHINSSVTFAPGGNVTTDKLHVKGTYSGNAETLTLTGTGTGTSRPLYIDSGTFTAGSSSTTTFTGAGNSDIESVTYKNFNLQPTSGTETYTLLSGSLQVNGNLTVNNGATLTVDQDTNDPPISLAGNLTLNSGTTWTRSPAITSMTFFPTGTKTWTDNNSTKQNIGTVNIGNAAGTISLGSSVKADKITIATSHTLDANGSNTITLEGTSGTLITNQGTFTQSTSEVIVTSASGTPTLLSGATTFHKLTINAAATVVNMGSAATINNVSGAALAITSGVFNVDANNITGPGASNGTLTISSGATLCLGGTINATNATCDSGATQTATRDLPSFQTYTFDTNSNVRFLSDEAQTVDGTPTYGNLYLIPKLTTNRIYTFETSTTPTINGNFTITPVASSTTKTLTVNPAGNITVASGKTTTISGTTTGASLLDLRPSASDYNLSTGLLTITNSGSGGTLDASSAVSTITLTGTSGTLFTQTGTFTQGTSEVIVTGAGTTTLLSAGTTFHKLTINNSSNLVNAGAAITLSNTDAANKLDIQSGTLDDGGNQIAGTTNGTMSMASGTTLRLGTTGTATTFPTNFTNGNITLNAASTVIYKATVNQTISGTPGYGHLQLSTASGTPTKTLSSTTIVNGNVTIDANNTLDVDNTNNYSLTIKGNYTNNGAFTARSGLVTLSGTATQTLSGTMTSGSAFYDITITNASGADASDCERTSFTPSIDFATDATSTHNLTFVTASTRVEYNSGSTYTFNNINWNGQASGTKLYFRNSATSGTWLLKVTGTQTAVSFINVSRSDASVAGGSAIVASNGTNTDCNNNTNWTFGSGSPTFNQVNYRFGSGTANNISYSSAPAENAAMTVTSTGQDFRLRMAINIGTATLTSSGQNFKLRFAEKPAAGCASGTYADVSPSSGIIRYVDIGGLTDGDTISLVTGDPNNTGTERYQTYEESNNFTNSVAAIASGENGIWDFSLENNSSVGGKTYCFKVTKSDGTNLDTYTNYPEVTVNEELTFTLDSTSKNFGAITPGSVPSDQATTLTTTTNASSGYQITLFATQLLTKIGGDTIANWTGSNASPTTLSGTGSSAFGYSTNDSSLAGGTANRFTAASDLFAGFVTTGPGDIVADTTSGPVSSQSFTITYRLRTAADQKAGTYTAPLIYINTASY